MSCTTVKFWKWIKLESGKLWWRFNFLPFAMEKYISHMNGIGTCYVAMILLNLLVVLHSVALQPSDIFHGCSLNFLFSFHFKNYFHEFVDKITYCSGGKYLSTQNIIKSRREKKKKAWNRKVEILESPISKRKRVYKFKTDK